jgi:hypothetical protein
MLVVQKWTCRPPHVFFILECILKKEIVLDNLDLIQIEQMAFGVEPWHNTRQGILFVS